MPTDPIPNYTQDLVNHLNEDTNDIATEYEPVDADLSTPSSRRNERPGKRTPKGKATSDGLAKGVQKWRKSKGKLLLQNAETGIWSVRRSA